MDDFGLPGGDWLAIVRLVALLIGGYFLVIWFASVLWVYRDIRARTSDPVSQVIGIAIAVVFPLIGLPVYLVLRPQETLQEAYDRQLEQEAILSELHSISACPDCRRPVTDEFMVCAYCGTQLRQPCIGCSALLQFAWRYCPYCASPQRRQAAPAPEPAADSAEPRQSNRDRPASRSGRSGNASDGGGATRRRSASTDVAEAEAEEGEPAVARSRRADESPAS